MQLHQERRQNLREVGMRPELAGDRVKAVLGEPDLAPENVAVRERLK